MAMTKVAAGGVWTCGRVVSGHNSQIYFLLNVFAALPPLFFFLFSVYSSERYIWLVRLKSNILMLVINQIF